MSVPEVTVFYGLYGSGKSEIAINYAVNAARQGKAVTLVDLDAVTPYFRVRDVAGRLRSLGVVVVAPKESVKHADLPVLPQGIRSILQEGPGLVVVDVGGDPTGARVFGGLRDAVSGRAVGLYVVNPFRPFSGRLTEAESSMIKVTQSAGLTPSGLVANGNLCEMTGPQHVVHGISFARALSEKSGVPLILSAAPEELRGSSEIEEAAGEIPVLWLQRYLLKPWEEEKGDE